VPWHAHTQQSKRRERGRSIEPCLGTCGDTGSVVFLVIQRVIRDRESQAMKCVDVLGCLGWGREGESIPCLILTLPHSDLSDNQIVSLPAGVFDNLTKLTRL
jgi:hypothetical protein